MELNLSQKQTQTLSPQMLQSMEILQMGSQELLEYIEEAVQENPVLEVAEPTPVKDEFTDIRHKLEWLATSDPQNRYYQEQEREEEDPLARYGGVDGGEESLYHYVVSQLQGLELAPELEEAAIFLIESLNQNGWLDEDLQTLAESMAVPLARAEEALELVQSFEPAGVGARDLAECLRLQLVRRGEDDALPLAIVEGYLDAVAKSRYDLIARALGTTAKEVRSACALIRELNPRPGTGFSARENLTYISPDIIVVSFPDHFELLTNDYFFPSLNLGAYYQSLMKETEDQTVRDYLVDKVHQAKWVVRSIEQRRGTLLNCAQCILEFQEPFFRKGPGHLVPMSLADVALHIGVHESTVSRAVRDKYIQCSQGVYPLGYFFSRGVGGQVRGDDGTSPDVAKALLRRLVAEEDRRHPLSDQKLSECMVQEGCTLSRRTVAKYRDELGIQSTTGRKLYE